MISAKDKKRFKKAVRSKDAQNDSDSSDSGEKISKEDIDYNAPKPGPHAKVNIITFKIVM